MPLNTEAEAEAGGFPSLRPVRSIERVPEPQGQGVICSPQTLRRWAKADVRGTGDRDRRSTQVYEAPNSGLPPTFCSYPSDENDRPRGPRCQPHAISLTAPHLRPDTRNLDRLQAVPCFTQLCMSPISAEGARGRGRWCRINLD